MTRLSCHRFRSNEVGLWLSVIAYNLGNVWRRLVLPNRIGNWSLTSLQQRLVNTGGRLVKVLLAAVGREPSDQAALRGDGSKDLRLAGRRRGSGVRQRRNPPLMHTSSALATCGCAPPASGASVRRFFGHFL
jgi:hypothetical protein